MMVICPSDDGLMKLGVMPGGGSNAGLGVADAMLAENMKDLGERDHLRKGKNKLPLIGGQRRTRIAYLTSP